MSQTITNVIGGLYQPYNFETLTISTAAVGLTSSKYKESVSDAMSQAQSVIITSESADVRYTIDGTTPVGGATGHLLLSGSTLVLIGYAAISKFLAIRNAGVDATFQVTYEK